MKVTCECDYCEYFDLGYCGADSIHLDDSGQCTTFEVWTPIDLIIGGTENDD